MNKKLNFINPYKELGEDFFSQAKPAKFPQHIVRFKNKDFYNLKILNHNEWIDLFGKFESNFLPDQRNLALKYHGHQFRTYNPQIGDGRGFTITQFLYNDKLFDLGTKGSGQTNFSRSGDGRLTLKGGIREVLCSEYLNALGVNTSRAISLIETGEKLYRNDEDSPTRSCVFVRASNSHIRIGSFQYQAYFQNYNNLEKLIKFVSVNLFHIDINKSLYENFFTEVVNRLARLAASYTSSGFVHGVLNTDNINITGESFDYGPYRFLEFYDPQKIAAYFDQTGLYKFSNQSDAIFWNIQQLASIMTLFLSEEKLIKILKTYSNLYNKNLLDLFFKRLGIKANTLELNQTIFRSFYDIQKSNKFLFEEVFYDFKNIDTNISLIKQKYSNFDFFNIFNKFDRDESLKINKNELLTLTYNEIEEIWNSIHKNDDWSSFDNKLKSINNLSNYK